MYVRFFNDICEPKYNKYIFRNNIDDSALYAFARPLSHNKIPNHYVLLFFSNIEIKFIPSTFKTNLFIESKTW